MPSDLINSLYACLYYEEKLRFGVPHNLQHDGGAIFNLNAGCWKEQMNKVTKPPKWKTVASSLGNGAEFGVAHDLIHGAKAGHE